MERAVPVVQTPKQLKEIFLERNPGCVEIRDSNNSFGEFISSNDEVWIMQCPKGMDISALQDQKLKLPGRSNQTTLEAVAVEYPQPIPHGFGYKNRKGHNSIKIVPVQGSIILRSRIKASIPPEEIPKQTSSGRPPMPEVIKERHPLHGANYAQKIEINPEIAERLKSASEVSSSSKRKKSKSKNKTKEPRTVAVDSDGDVELVMQKKPKKKRKHLDTDESEAPEKKKKSKTNGLTHDLEWIEKL